eukprot:8105244-Pyramimonas_sp.AAC.1
MAVSVVAVGVAAHAVVVAVLGVLVMEQRVLEVVAVGGKAVAVAVVVVVVVESWESVAHVCVVAALKIAAAE